MNASHTANADQAEQHQAEQGQTARTTVCLVRHGETDWNAEGRLQGQEDTPLNTTGYAQAQRAGEYLRQWEWDRLIASPLARARDTAIEIGKAIGLPLHAQWPEFMERDYGEAAGMTPAEMRTAFPDPDRIPRLESPYALQARMLRGLNALVARYPGQRIVLVAHGGIINAGLATLTNGAIGSGKTKLGNACISLFHHEGETWSIEYYNYQDHLSGATQSAPSAYVGVE